MNADVLQHLANEPGLTFHVEHTGRPGMTRSPRLCWYAAFRDPDADELTPERGWGYGASADEAIEAAVASFRANEDEAGR